MTDDELDQLAALWREPDPIEQEKLEAIAAKARRRARLLGYTDALLLGTFLAATLVSLIPSPNAAAILLALLLVAFMVWLNWKRRLVRQMSLTLHTSDREAFLDGAIESARRNLRGNLVALWLFVPAMLLAILFKLATRHGGIGPALANVPAWLVSVRGLTSMCVLFGIAGWLLFIDRRIRAEIERLQALKLAYRDEAGLEPPDAG